MSNHNQPLDWLIGREVTAVDYLPGGRSAELTFDDGSSVEFESWWDWGIDAGGMTVIRYEESTRD